MKEEKQTTRTEIKKTASYQTTQRKKREGGQIHLRRFFHTFAENWKKHQSRKKR
jgi:hypothetical protein